MFFADLLPSDSHRDQYKKVCTEFSSFLKDCLTCLIEAYKTAGLAAGKSNEVYHSAIILLTRHVIEHLDGVAILISQGSSQPCLPLLRSALEATLGIMYMLKADTKRRALAYQVAHTHERLKFFDRIDPTTDRGRDLRKQLGYDAYDLFGKVPVQYYVTMLDQIKSLTAMLANSDFGPIEQEWQAFRKKYKKDPEWYGLFGGPQNVRDLAANVGWALMYEFCYRNWSNEVHAGSAMDAAGEKDGEGVFRPIRHPDELQPSLVHAMNFTLQLSLILVEAYAPDKKADLKHNYVDQIYKRKMELLDKKVITAPWKNSHL